MSRPCVCGGSNENCRYCGGRGEIGDRLADALVVHSKQPAKLSGGRKTKAETSMETEVAARRIERRSLRLSRLRSLILGPLPESAPPASEKEWESCPVCKTRVKARALDRHLNRVHRNVNRQKPPAAQGSTDSSLVQSAQDVLRETTSFAVPRDKNLDATKLYAHSYREKGRFGSYPSHDSFDDESSTE